MAGPPSLISDPSQNRGPAVIGLFIGFTVASGIFVALRLGIRINRRLFGRDDALITFAMVSSVAMTVTVGIACLHGYGKHIADIADPPRALVWFYGAQICYKCITWPTKLSILFLYQRIFGDTPNIKSYGVQFRYLLWAMMVVVVGSFISTTLVGIFACSPIRYSWNRSIDGHCVPTIPWWFTYAALNISTDIVILALPIPLIKGLLQITKRQKFILMGVFAIGAFVCIVTIIRMTTLKTGSRASDPTYFGVDTLMWTCVETNLGIMCACLPLLRPLLNKFFPWFARRTSAGTVTRPSYVAGGTPVRTNKYPSQNSWGNWGKGQNVIMSNVSGGRRASAGSSEDGITDGIVVVTKVDVEADDGSFEDLGSDHERQDSHAASSKYVV